MEINVAELEEEDRLKSIFGSDEKPIQRLGQGTHCILSEEKNIDLFYYTIRTKDKPHVITSERKEYSVSETEGKDKKGQKVIFLKDEIKDSLGINYSHDFDADSVDTIWENKDVLDYLLKKMMLLMFKKYLIISLN